jgi:hypothetical protein
MRVSVRLPQHRLEFPYFHLFQLIEKWTKDEKRYMTSWLEFITRECGLEYNSQEYFIYWNHPELWSETFRDIMRQTWTNKDFLLTEWNDNTISEVDINWKLWEEEFKYGI